MNEQQLQLVGDGPDRVRWSEFDADFRPRAVVRQGLGALRLFDSRGRLLDAPTADPSSIWDPCAGAGVFGSVARELFPDTLLVGSDARREELPHLEHNYHHAAIAEFAAGYLLAPQRPAWIVTNPPWSLWPELVESVWPMVELGTTLALLGPIGWGASFEHAEGLETMLKRRPVAELRIPERIRFRRGINPKNGKPYGSDHRKCAWWVFKRQARPKKSAMLLQWTTYVLPKMRDADYEWTVRPGTEYLAA